MKIYMKTDYTDDRKRTFQKGSRLQVTNELGKKLVDAGAAREIKPFSVTSLPAHLTQGLPIITRQSGEVEEE